MRKRLFPKPDYSGYTPVESWAVSGYASEQVAGWEARFPTPAARLDAEKMLDPNYERLVESDRGRMAKRLVRAHRRKEK